MLPRGRSLLDYLNHSAGEVFAPVTMRYASNLQKLSFRSSFADLIDSADYWLPWEASNFKDLVERLVISRGVEIISFDDFFSMVFGRVPPPVLFVAQGAQFAASRDVLRRLPRSALQQLMQLLEAGHEELAYYLEFSWYYLLHGFDADALNEAEKAASRDDGAAPRPGAPT